MRRWTISEQIQMGAMDPMVWYRRKSFAASLFSLALVVLSFATLAVTEICLAGPKDAKEQLAPKIKTHRIVVQVDSDEPTTMRHAITNALNAVASYREKQQPFAIEIVAYGSGVHMFRADTSPVKGLLQLLRANDPEMVFSVCGNTKTIMEQNEGHPMSLVDGAHVVPSGVVRLVELQEDGWSYLRP